MTEPKFTPGPWYVDGTFVTNDEDLDICSMGDIAWEANAHLIAAAPELYEACLAMVEDGWLYCGPEGMSEAQQKVYDALAKARGESHD